MEADKLSKQTTDIVVREKELEIITIEDANAAGAFLKEVTTFEKEIKTLYKPMKQAADAAKNKILDSEKKSLEPFVFVKASVKQKLTAFQAEEEKKRQELQEKLRLEAEAEAIKIAEEEVLAAAVESGEDEVPEVDVAKIKATVITPVVQAPKMNFITTKTWSAEVTDFSMLPDEYKKADEVKLNQIARAMKDGFSIPGARAVFVTSTKAGR